MSDFLCIGHATYDTFLKVDNADMHCAINDNTKLVCFGFGLKVPVSEVNYGVGGGASNVAVGLKKLGIQTAIFTIVGSDSRGTDVAANFMSKGVDTTYIHMDNDATDQSSILSYSEERTIFTYSKDREYRLDTLDRHFNHVFLSSVGKNVHNLYKDVIGLKEANPDMILYYNPGSKELRHCREDIEMIAPYVDYLVINIEEGCKIINSTLERENIEVEDLSNLLCEKGIKNVILTDGPNGAHLTNSTDHFHIDAIKTQVIEKTGAGDAFASGFIGGVYYGRDLLECVKWGVLNSASAIQIIGAQNGLLNKEEIEKQLEEKLS